MLTETNSEGKPVVKMTEEQQYTFDLKGWLPVKGLLSKDEIDEMVAFAYQLKEDKESVPEKDRSTIGGPTAWATATSSWRPTAATHAKATTNGSPWQ